MQYEYCADHKSTLNHLQEHIIGNIINFTGFLMLLTEFKYRLGTVNSKSFVGKGLLRIKWKFKLTEHFKHEMLGK